MGVKRVCMQGDSLCPTAPGDYQPTPAGLNQAITDAENLHVQNNQGTLIQITAGDFMQDAKVIISKPEKKGKSNALHLTFSDGKVTHDACFRPLTNGRFTRQPLVRAERQT